NSFFRSDHGHTRALHPFPTRRSSDLSMTSAPAARAPSNAGSVFSGSSADAPRCATTSGEDDWGNSVGTIATSEVASVYSRPRSGQIASVGGSRKADPIGHAHRGETEMDWVHRALCKDEDPELFFPVGTTGPAASQIDAAKAVCGRCEVRLQCLEWSMGTCQTSGVWGGLSEAERR